MVTVTDPQPTPRPTSEQLAGEACIDCGTDQKPLHPAGTLTVDGEIPGVVHDHNVAKCTGCLVVNQ